ncbi:MAG: anthranilate phosphoribosyltransferase [Micavibrio aeruginosavorus]|uniref:Anthranilate phosphoribosyltransferase n=1 Tax=Micavibrio aeruginosavorus TaxID=349221 RepID=A0A7T5R0N2_9BACT|nr:MAG: anthranilate phosphoribosyltransferase [Micavibrio aeruginosavorus]
MSLSLEKLRVGVDLSESEMIAAMTAIMDGGCAEEDIIAFLTYLTKKGETVDEITGAARVMREKAATIKAPPDAIDCCGTGGDGSGTYNISTAVALVVAACGVPVAKHGNRAASSKSGAADVLEALGVNLDVSHDKLEDALNRFHFAFLMAPRHHSAMKHVVPIRKKLGFRTIFNLLGPLSNPAGTRRQLLGVFDEKWLTPMARTLDRLGTEKAWVVHGQDGLDEITVTGKTRIARLERNHVEEKNITPQLFGLDYSSTPSLMGGDAKYNADALKRLLGGEIFAYRNIVLANAAAALLIADITANPHEASHIAAEALDSGRARKLLADYIEFTRMA